MAVTDHKDRTVNSTHQMETLRCHGNLTNLTGCGIATTAEGKYLVADWSKGRVTMHDTDGMTFMSFPQSTKGQNERVRFT